MKGNHVKTHWFKNAVVYQIYPFSFLDSNNDGWGDISGIISKLDYIRDLGVTAIWFSPLYKSPDYDYGYDISDYRDIDEKFGTMADFDRLLEECHKRDLRVIMDMVLNHTSTEQINVENDLNSERSIYRFYQKLLRIRKDCDTAIYGKTVEYDHENRKILAYSREYEDKRLFIAANFSKRKVSYQLPEWVRGCRLLLNNYESVEQNNLSVMFKPYQSVVFEEQPGK